jgi:hypothetical protein
MGTKISNLSDISLISTKENLDEGDSRFYRTIQIRVDIEALLGFQKTRNSVSACKRRAYWYRMPVI